MYLYLLQCIIYNCLKIIERKCLATKKSARSENKEINKDGTLVNFLVETKDNCIFISMVITVKLGYNEQLGTGQIRSL